MIRFFSLSTTPLATRLLRHHTTPLGASSLATTPLAATVTAATLTLAVAAPAPASATAAENPTGTPKNIIVMIGDGMGYNTLDLLNLYQRKTTGYQIPHKGITPRNTPQPGFQSWARTSMSTYPFIGFYNSRINWSGTRGATGLPTDSAAAGTAMATGHKTYRGVIGLDPLRRPVENLTERAKALGKAAGVVSSVPYSHATPAAYVAHEVSRENYHHITTQMLKSSLDVVIAPGHPLYDDNHKHQRTPSYKYISETDWAALSGGKTPFTFMENTADFTELARTNKNYGGKRIWGIPQVASTLQQERSSRLAKAAKEKVGQTPRNNVPTLSELALGALNVVDDNPRGAFLMIEGGAIDWAGHDNQPARLIEETAEFAKAVEDVTAWVEKYSSWKDTLLIVTADHETGFVNGPSTTGFHPLTSTKAGLPDMTFLSDEHTNQLVPFFVRGAGSRTVLNLATQNDTVRGKYMDNTDFPRLVMGRWWLKH